MVFVVETSNGVVTQVIPFMDSPGIDALEAANNLAKIMCVQNGIVFEGTTFKGSVNCDCSPVVYSIQVVEAKNRKVL